MDYGIHWFRRDLRVSANPVFRRQFELRQGKVLGFCCLGDEFMRAESFSHHRLQAFMETAKSLRDELRSIGSDLIFFNLGPELALKKLLDVLGEQKSSALRTFSWNKDLEPSSFLLEQKLTAMLNCRSCEVLIGEGDLLIQPHEIQKNDGTAYKVYSSFAKTWLRVFQSAAVQDRVSAAAKGIPYIRKLQQSNLDKIFSIDWAEVLGNRSSDLDQLDEALNQNLGSVTIDIPDVGTVAAWEALSSFEDKLSDYEATRDYPHVMGTSKLSIHLRYGCLSTAQIIAHLKLHPYEKKSCSRDVYFSELIWREFYHHVLCHFPHVEKEAFLKPYRNIVWANDKAWFERWKDGRTGFPIVDAGMQELKQTGWMHNRVRMIVASFLCKDLLIDWKWGERYFMEQLLDGDLAANNGGWQWAASTGCDAQPYFRIFNPWRQGERFDSKAEYIKAMIPPLRNLAPKKCHGPILNLDAYPEPLVEHSVQREKALRMYKGESKI